MANVLQMNSINLNYTILFSFVICAYHSLGPKIENKWTAIIQISRKQTSVNME